MPKHKTFQMSGAKKRQAAKLKATELKYAVDNATRLDRFLVHSKTKPDESDDVVVGTEASSSVLLEVPAAVEAGTRNDPVDTDNEVDGSSECESPDANVDTHHLQHDHDQGIRVVTRFDGYDN